MHVAASLFLSLVIAAASLPRGFFSECSHRSFGLELRELVISDNFQTNTCDAIGKVMCGVIFFGKFMCFNLLV